MKKEILNLGKALNKVDQKQINGGINFSDYFIVGCFTYGGGSGQPGGGGYSPGHYSNGSAGAPGIGNGQDVCTWQHRTSGHRITVRACQPGC
ncbi:hypothetical protein [Tenacibaculum sp. 190524A02b]|uniref:hypothetical protein n=1 Tax=Tenacibaculum vairaonense TaxID=3137860 RepID=UPI0031FAC1F0